MLLKKDFGVRASKFDSKDESRTQHRFKQPLTRIRLLRALSRQLTSPAGAGSAEKCQYAPSRELAWASYCPTSAKLACATTSQAPSTRRKTVRRGACASTAFPPIVS